MRNSRQPLRTLALLLSSAAILFLSCAKVSDNEDRMQWWRQARLGMFIHWGLYAVPAGEWNGETRHAEWIRHTAQIPLQTYEKFADRFNPEKFDADEWVRLAKEAGMKYIVITTKHHDGFCLFDSKYTDFDIMSTPFKRDIMKEIADACHKQGMRLGWYYSIMDWRHPDYLPRRAWEKDRSAEGADFDRYVQYMKNQLRELLTHYGDVDILWFDGEWESTWNREYGRDLYMYVRSLQPDIIVNNRVGAGRSGMEGFTKGDEYAGDFGTPEQHIPATGLPGVDWETCMTMNNHWGYNRNDHDWKSATDLLRKLADIASKGGNFLLNVGPTAEGLIPQPSVERLQAMGRWMKVNGEAIYGAKASPFKSLPWGRCTQKAGPDGTILYLHVFEWPADGRLVLSGIYNEPVKAWLLADAEKRSLRTSRREDAIVIDVPAAAPDSINSVVALHIKGRPDVNDPPEFRTEFDSFIDELEVVLDSDRENVAIRYTLDGSEPTGESPLFKKSIRLKETTLVSARCFRDGRPVSGVVQHTFTKVAPQPAVQSETAAPGLNYAYYEGDWDSLPDFRALSPKKKGVVKNFDFSMRDQLDYFGVVYTGLIRIPKSDVYAFYTDSDDGSRLLIDDRPVVENDGLHGMREKKGVIALEEGLHAIRVEFFEKTGGDGLEVSIRSRSLQKQPIDEKILYHQ